MSGMQGRHPIHGVFSTASPSGSNSNVSPLVTSVSVPAVMSITNLSPVQTRSISRVFASSDQLSLFRAYHDVDEAVRTAITERMKSGAPEPTVLQGLNFEATGKIAGVGNLPLSPGARPFVTVINDSRQADPNADIVAGLFARPSSDLTVANVLRGRILDVPLELTEAAELLDRLTFADYQPESKGFHADFWSGIEARANAVAPLPDSPFYRPPGKLGKGDQPRREVAPKKWSS